jgi:hypothetical protein
MMRQPTRTRQLAVALVDHAATVMPGALMPWARAIQNELAYVDDDREALKWAASSVHVAYAARLRHLYLLDLLPVRVAGAVVAASCAFDMTFATAMTTAYHLHAIAMTEVLARMTPGDDYRRLIPLMEAIPRGSMDCCSQGACATCSPFSVCWAGAAERRRCCSSA